jgi:hypothetical protein
VKSWRVNFAANGSIASVVPLEGEQGTDWVIVQAPDEATAKRRAYNIYCARKKKLAKTRLHAAGNCCCGRKQDRKHPDGTPMLTCTVCAERHAAQSKACLERKANPPAVPHVRDEQARVASNLERQRDRRAEIRLEVLIEVRDQWFKSRNVGLFSKWLERELQSLTSARKSA